MVPENLVLRSQLSVRATLATSIYAKMPCSNLVKYYMKFLTSDMLETMLLKLHAKLAPGWELIQVNLDPIQETGSKVGGGRSFMIGHSFVRLCAVTAIRLAIPLGPVQKTYKKEPSSISDPLTFPGCVAPRSSVGEGGVRWVPVPCGSSSRGCVRGCWPDPEEQRRRCILFISLFISNKREHHTSSIRCHSYYCLYFCGDYSRAVTIRGRLLFEGGYYLRVVTI